jgi:hypothetical protein
VKLGYYRIYAAFHAAQSAEVALGLDGFDAFLFNDGRDLPELISVAIDHGDVRAFFCESDRRGPADAIGRSGNEYSLARQSRFHAA